jgi:DNA-binding MarR family transcriptional regulator
MSPAARKPKDDGNMNAETCARRVLETVPMVMRAIRREMRGASEEQLSVPQFRVLAFLGHRRGASLSAVSEHLGVKDATASAMVDRLVKRGWIERETHPEERRRVVLSLTSTGASLMDKARRRARSFLAAHLDGTSPADLQILASAMDVLRRILSEETQS